MQHTFINTLLQLRLSIVVVLLCVPCLRSVYGQVGVLVKDVENVSISELVDIAVTAARSMALADVADGDQLVVLQRRKATSATQVRFGA